MIHYLRILPLLLGLSLLLPAGSMAGTPLPVIHEPEGEGVKCVQPEEEMRRNHMNYILHQRDKTMHQGIRTENYALSRCIDCHIEPDSSGKVASHTDEEHFCTSCHQYASVQIDCFQCHADKPQKHIKRDKTAEIERQLKTILAARKNGSDL